MFNLTVDEAHTFYVGQDGWLVHNAGPGCGPVYKVDAKAMEPHTNGQFKNANGEDKSQFLYGVDANQATLDAAKYADANGLWANGKAKVPVLNGDIGVLARTGEPTSYINV